MMCFSLFLTVMLSFSLSLSLSLFLFFILRLEIIKFIWITVWCSFFIIYTLSYFLSLFLSFSFYLNLINRFFRFFHFYFSLFYIFFSFLSLSFLLSLSLYRHLVKPVVGWITGTHSTLAEYIEAPPSTLPLLSLRHYHVPSPLWRDDHKTPG